MKFAILIFWISSSLVVGGRAEESPTAKAVDLGKLPPLSIDGGEVTYRVDPYIAAAKALQTMGKQEALRRLADFASEERHHLVEGWSPYRTQALYVLCRMLFVARDNIPFRAPVLGVSGGDPKRDPLEPIHIVDGVPFLTFQGGYLLGGAAEDPISYLLFCITHCDWSPYAFAPKSMDEKRAALQKLLEQNPRLESYREGLQMQIQPCVTAAAPEDSIPALKAIADFGQISWSDGSSFYTFAKDGSFKSGPLGWSGRTMSGRWVEDKANGTGTRFIVTARLGWENGASEPEYRRIAFYISHVFKRSERLKPRLDDVRDDFGGYFSIDEMTVIQKPPEESLK